MWRYQKYQIWILAWKTIQKNILEREIAGLRYIGEYIVHKLYNKLGNHKNWKETELREAVTHYTFLNNNLVLIKT